MVNKDKLSPQARKLLELAGVGNEGQKPDLSGILKQHPELFDGLNEYYQYSVDYWTNVGQIETQTPTAHPLSGTSRGVPKKK